VTVTAALRELDRVWTAAHASADALRLTVREDAPVRNPRPGRPPGAGTGEEPLPKPAETAAELITDLVSVLDAGARRLHAALPVDDEVAGSADELAAVSFAQDRWLEAADALAGLLSPRRLFDLADFVDRHGGEWRPWWRLVIQGLDDLEPALREIAGALARCWREFAERPHVTVASAAVGRLRVHTSDSAPTDAPGAQRRGAPVLRSLSTAPTTGER